MGADARFAWRAWSSPSAPPASGEGSRAGKSPSGGWSDCAPISSPGESGKQRLSCWTSSAPLVARGAEVFALPEGLNLPASLLTPFLSIASSPFLELLVSGCARNAPISAVPGGGVEGVANSRSGGGGRNRKSGLGKSLRHCERGSGAMTLRHAGGMFSSTDPAGLDTGREEGGRVGGLGNVVWVVFFEKEEG